MDERDHLAIARPEARNGAPPGSTVTGSHAGPATAAVLDVDALDAGFEDEGYQRRLGARLRSVRRAQGLRLQDVEERSEGRFKAVVIGSYERGDRAVATHKLAALADFYGVPVAELLPEDGWPAATSLGAVGVRLSVSALHAAGGDPEVASLQRLVQHVRVLRGDHHGQVLTLRGDDLRTVAITLALDIEELAAWLDARGLLAHR